MNTRTLTASDLAQWLKAAPPSSISVQSDQRVFEESDDSTHGAKLESWVSGSCSIKNNGVDLSFQWVARGGRLSLDAAYEFDTAVDDEEPEFVLHGCSLVGDDGAPLSPVEAEGVLMAALSKYDSWVDSVELPKKHEAENTNKAEINKFSDELNTHSHDLGSDGHAGREAQEKHDKESRRLVAFGTAAAKALYAKDPYRYPSQKDSSVLVWVRPEGLTRAGECAVLPTPVGGFQAVEGFATRVWADGSHQHHGVVNGKMGWLPKNPPTPMVEIVRNAPAVPELFSALPIGYATLAHWGSQEASVMKAAADVISAHEANPWVFIADSKHFHQFAGPAERSALLAMTPEQRSAVLETETWDRDDWNAFKHDRNLQCSESDAKQVVAIAALYESDSARFAAKPEAEEGKVVVFGEHTLGTLRGDSLEVLKGLVGSRGGISMMNSPYFLKGSDPTKVRPATFEDFNTFGVSYHPAYKVVHSEESKRLTAFGMAAAKTYFPELPHGSSVLVQRRPEGTSSAVEYEALLSSARGLDDAQGFVTRVWPDGARQERGLVDGRRMGWYPKIAASAIEQTVHDEMAGALRIADVKPTSLNDSGIEQMVRFLKEKTFTLMDVRDINARVRKLVEGVEVNAEEGRGAIIEITPKFAVSGKALTFTVPQSGLDVEPVAASVNARGNNHPGFTRPCAVNDKGLEEIAAFLAKYHKHHSDTADTAKRDVQRFADVAMADVKHGGAAFIELSAWNSNSGKKETLEISGEGLDYETYKVDVDGHETSTPNVQVVLTLKHDNHSEESSEPRSEVALILRDAAQRMARSDPTLLKAVESEIPLINLNGVVMGHVRIARVAEGAQSLTISPEERAGNLAVELRGSFPSGGNTIEHTTKILELAADHIYIKNGSDFKSFDRSTGREVFGHYHEPEKPVKALDNASPGNELV